MSLDPITAGLDLVDDIVKLFPDKNAQEQAQLRLKLQELVDETQIAAAQSAIDTAEAASSSLFVSGARPSIMWICAASFAWQFVLLPIVLFIYASLHVTMPSIPNIDTATLNNVLMGMLGLGALHAYESVKTKGKK